jgi:hypothetical protein
MGTYICDNCGERTDDLSPACRHCGSRSYPKWIDHWVVFPGLFLVFILCISGLGILIASLLEDHVGWTAGLIVGMASMLAALIFEFVIGRRRGRE